MRIGFGGIRRDLRVFGRQLEGIWEDLGETFFKTENGVELDVVIALVELSDRIVLDMVDLSDLVGLIPVWSCLLWYCLVLFCLVLSCRVRPCLSL